MKRLLLIFLWLVATPAVFCQTSGILPETFNGWQKSQLQKSTDPAKADNVNPALLKEYGFTDMEAATYTQSERKMTVKAARFSDATGSYGAFTYYKTPEMATEKIGDQASSNGTHVIFYKGNVLVDLKLDAITAMSAADLRELANSIPLPPGVARNLPSLPTYLPKEGYVKNSAKYVLGPIGFEKIEPSIPVSQVNFAKGAEVVQGDFDSDRGTARLTLVSYPTPQIAAEEIKALDAAHASEAKADVPSFFSRRSGPIVAVVTGPISTSGAKALLSLINYDATITWNENTFVSKKDNVAGLLVNIVVLIGILFGLAIVMGIAFGGTRVLLRKLFPGRFLDRAEGAEFLRLDIGNKGAD